MGSNFHDWVRLSWGCNFQQNCYNKVAHFRGFGGSENSQVGRDLNGEIFTAFILTNRSVYFRKT